MNFALEFAPDAKSQWRELEVELQEVSLDALDSFAANSAAMPDGICRQRVECYHGGDLHYFVLRIPVSQEGGWCGVLTKE